MKFEYEVWVVGAIYFGYFVAALVAAVLYRAVREGHLGLEAIEKHFGKEVARLIDGVLNMAAISQLQANASAKASLVREPSNLSGISNSFIYLNFWGKLFIEISHNSGRIKYTKKVNIKIEIIFINKPLPTISGIRR